jgi:undecaprenyl-diphosphatase
MLTAEYVVRKAGGTQVPTPWRGFIVGFFQALALIPGMSRSGMVISGGLLLGFSRDMAIRFGFMLSFPIILGAGGVKFLSILGGESAEIVLLPLVVAGITSFVAGLLAIHFLVRFLKKNTLLPFVIYRFIVAGIILAFL